MKERWPAYPGGLRAIRLRAGPLTPGPRGAVPQWNDSCGRRGVGAPGSPKGARGPSAGYAGRQTGQGRARWRRVRQTAGQRSAVTRGNGGHVPPDCHDGAHTNQLRRRTNGPLRLKVTPGAASDHPGSPLGHWPADSAGILPLRDPAGRLRDWALFPGCGHRAGSSRPGIPVRSRRSAVVLREDQRRPLRPGLCGLTGKAGQPRQAVCAAHITSRQYGAGFPPHPAAAQAPGRLRPFHRWPCSLTVPDRTGTRSRHASRSARWALGGSAWLPRTRAAGPHGGQHPGKIINPAVTVGQPGGSPD
jgi:hypothetical protein